MRWPLAVWRDEPYRMRTAKPCGPDVSTLTSTRQECFRILPGMVTKKPDHQGERGISRNPSRREGRIASGVPVVTNSCPTFFRTRGCGCVKHPAFPAPSVFGGALISGKARAKQAARTRRCVLLRHCAEHKRRPVFARLARASPRFESAEAFSRVGGSNPAV
jgi:hypothetical protein